VRRISERDGNIAFEDSEDEEEGMAMSLVQLDRHSARKTGADATDAEQDRINAQKAMNARLERINLQKRAQELKESREKLLQRTASSSSVNARKTGESQQEIETASYYLCMYRAPQTKKHKSWDNDGFIKVIDSGRCRLYDLESKRL
jgi:DNA repair and recombination protein RAD54B